MRTILFIILFISSLSSSIYCQEYTLSTDKSKLNWTGKAAFSSYTLSGTINAKSGFLKHNNEGISETKVVINTKTIDSSIGQLKKHLRSKDFFDVNKYPVAEFLLDELTPTKEGHYLAKGWMTIKEKKEAFECELNIQSEGNEKVARGKAIIDRTKYGITFNSPTFFESMKDQAIADDFEVEFELWFIRE
ncbi:MAG: YceI family protein [Bacteroidota bacterium]